MTRHNYDCHDCPWYGEELGRKQEGDLPTVICCPECGSIHVEPASGIA